MGLYLVWKDKGLLSQDCLFKFKKTLAQKSGALVKSRLNIGHTGTLDPFAEGLLLVGTGEGTKLLAPLTGLDKSYQARMFMGASSDSLDETGALILPESPLSLNLENITNKIQDFLPKAVGKIMQVPPALSAIKVDGKRAYDRVRAGERVEMTARPAEIISIEHESLREFILEKGSASVPGLEWVFRVQVAAGTYIRSLARDWGEALCGFPGMLLDLRRSAIGPFEIGAPLERAATGIQVYGLTGIPEFRFRQLGLDDLRSLFDTHTLEPLQASRLLATGAYPLPETLERPLLLLAPDKVQPVAWVQPGPPVRLGRVFLRSPFDPDDF